MAGESWKLIFCILDEEAGVEKYSEMLFGLQDSWYRFRSVCKIANTQIISKIIMNLKLVQLRTYYLSRTSDEIIFKNITGIINTNYIQIISHILATPVCANAFVQNLRKFNIQALDLLLEISEVIKQQDCLILTAIVLFYHLDYER
jgi:hypothetical protein